jgi:hypothetical protein
MVGEQKETANLITAGSFHFKRRFSFVPALAI